LSRLRRPLALLALLVVAAGLSACGKHPDTEARVQHLEGEGFYLSLGDLKYQVQGSRQLNPDDTQDRQYLVGVPDDQRTLEDDEVWFGVFMQVENEADEPLRPSGEIEIIDTQEDVFKPLAVDDANQFVYRSTDPIPPGQVMPLADTAAFDSPVRGSLLLFKLSLEALENRPLELKIEGTQTPPQTGIIDLDV